jgi:hypothetical protein
LRGNCSHWQPVRMRKMMPLRARRQSACLRPVALAGQKSTRRGKILSQRGSGISQIVARGLALRVVLLGMVGPPGVPLPLA